MTGFIQMVSSISSSVAVLAIACAGLSAVLRLSSLRDRFFAAAIIGFAASLLTSLILSISHAAALDCDVGAGSIAAAVPVSPALVVAVVLGHLALAVVLLRWRTGAERVRQRITETERARARGRARLSPDGEERQP